MRSSRAIEQKIKELKASRARKLRAAAEEYASTLRVVLGVQGAPGRHSRPGGAPYRQSGELQASVEVKVSGDRAEVRCTAPHAKYVLKLRPALEIAARRCREGIRRILSWGS